MGEVNASKPRATTVVVMGRTGNGKSATANSILGRNAFKSGFSYSTLTKECDLQQTTLKGGRILNVVDTPGLFDPVVTTDFFVKEIAKCIELAKDGIHAVLLVVSVRNRFSPEEASVLDGMQMLFGPKIINYMIIIFTGGDVLESDNLTLEDYLNDCPETLKELLRRCNMRMVIFNNKTKSDSTKEKQLTQLLKQIDSVIAENGQPYSNELFHEAQAMSSKLGGRERTLSQRDCSQEEMNRTNIEQQRQSTEKAISEKLLSKKGPGSQKEYCKEEIDQANVKQAGQSTEMLICEDRMAFQRDHCREGMDKANVELLERLTQMVEDKFGIIAERLEERQERTDENIQRLGQEIKKLKMQTPQAMFDKFCVIL